MKQHDRLEQHEQNVIKRTVIEILYLINIELSVIYITNLPIKLMAMRILAIKKSLKIPNG